MDNKITEALSAYFKREFEEEFDVSKYDYDSPISIGYTEVGVDCDFNCCAYALEVQVDFTKMEYIYKLDGRIIMTEDSKEQFIIDDLNRATMEDFMEPLFNYFYMEYYDDWFENYLDRVKIVFIKNFGLNILSHIPSKEIQNFCKRTNGQFCHRMLGSYDDELLELINNNFGTY